MTPVQELMFYRLLYRIVLVAIVIDIGIDLIRGEYREVADSVALFVFFMALTALATYGADWARRRWFCQCPTCMARRAEREKE